MVRLDNGAIGRYFGSYENLIGSTMSNLNGLLLRQGDISVADRPSHDSEFIGPLSESDATKPFFGCGSRSMLLRCAVAATATAHALDPGNPAFPKVNSEFVGTLMDNTGATPEQIACLLGTVVSASCSQVGVPGLGELYARQLKTHLPEESGEEFL